MPVSGCKEPGIIARQSSESSAGVPIKKRKFHLVRPPSPAPQTSPPLEPDLQYKEQSNSKSESYSKAASGYSVGDAIKSPSHEKNRELCADRNVNLVQSKINHPEFNFQEPSLAVASFSGSEIGGDEKPKVTDKSTLQTIAGNIELQLAPNEALVNKPEEISSEKVLMKNDPVKKQVSTELILAPNEPMVPDVAGQNSVRFQKEEEKLDPQLWNIGLNKGKSSFKANSDDNESKINLCPKTPNRSHWDLNTSMERWNNSAMVPGLGIINRSNLAESSDVKPLMSSSENVISELKGTLVDQGKQNVVKSKCATQLFNSCPPLDQHKTEDLLHLSLNTASALHSDSGRKPSSLSSKLDIGRTPSNLNLSEKSVSQSNNQNFVGSRPVKSEPSDDSNQKDLKEAKVGHAKAKCGVVKSEPFEDCLQEPKRSSNRSNLGLVGHGVVKSEPICGFNGETLVTTGETSQKSELLYNQMTDTPINGNVLPSSDGPICPTNIPMISGPQELPTRLGLSSSVETSSHSAFPTCTEAMPSGDKIAQVAIENVGAIASDLVSESFGSVKNSEVAESMLNKTERFGATDSESSKLTLTANPHLDSCGNGEVAESDDEKISLSDDMQVDSSSDSDVSDHDNAVGGIGSKDKHDDGEDGDYEDGEVREPLVQSSSKGGVYEDGQSEHANHGDKDGNDIDVSRFSGSDHATNLSQAEDKDAKVEDPGEIMVSHGSGHCDNLITCEKHDQDGNSVPCLAESSSNEASPAATEKKKTIKSVRRKPLDHAGKEAGLKGCETELISEGAGSASQGTMMRSNQGGSVSKQENVEEAKQHEAKSTVFSKVETVASNVELTKDGNIGEGNHRRIINLARNGSSSSSGRMRSIPGRLLPSRTERERLTDVVLSGDKLLPRGNRDDSTMDGAQKFEKQRSQDQSVGRTGSGFMHGRGRIDKHLESSRGDWESDHNFGLDNFNGPTSFRFSGPKSASGVSASKVECNGLVSRDGTIVGGGRGGRKPLNDEVPSFHHPPRRRSPTGREGPVSHGVQLLRRPPRDSSPDRCLGGGGPDLIGLRREEKFIRGPPDEMMGPMFSRPQPQYQRVRDPFVRRDRSFSPIQRRGPLHVTRIRSKSPPGSRARSPGPWSSPRRRSPDAFGQHELVHRRTSPFYRMERMRSPPHQSLRFPEDMVARRHGSPPFMSQLPNDMREMGPIREHDHPRFIPNRSPSSRVLPRNGRRFDIMDPREEMEREEYLGGHIPSDRFHELGGDGIADDRRILERRVHSFRPHFNGSDLENFRFHAGGPRPYRFSPEAETEFHERGNLRVREFERRVKNRPGNTPRRTRSIEEQEENFRHGEQGWHDASFEDVARLKRRRF